MGEGCRKRGGKSGEQSGRLWEKGGGGVVVRVDSGVEERCRRM